MKIKDHLKESHLFFSRAVIAGLIVTATLILLVARLFQLQVVEHKHFTTLSKDNRVKLIPQPPTRGLIYDRKGVLLAQNRPSYNLEIVPEDAGDLDLTLQRLGEIVEIDADDRERFNRFKRRKRRFDSIPILTNLSTEEAARFAVVRHQFPGVDIKAHLLRHYPYPEATGHVIGYVGRVSQRDLKQIDPSNYAGSSHIGKTGIEKSYEAALHGTVGVQQVEVNAIGRIARILEHNPPLPGQNLHLHLDIDLQKTTIEALGDHNGAAVAIDPGNGGVLALVSKPGYNPNLFVEGISSKDYKALQQNPDRPLYDRALRGQYPPGSTIKPFVSLGGLESRHISANSRIYCNGYFQLPGHEHKYRDWKKQGHGYMNMADSVIQSCDVYYYRLAHEMGVDALSQYLRHFGFGQKTGIDLKGEASGILPSREWKRNARRLPWYPGETVIMGIGQGYFLTTPLQLAAATAAIANGGKYYTPRLVKNLQTRGANPKQEPVPSNSTAIPIKQEQNWQAARDAMLGVVENIRGTAKRIASEHYRIAGKTGTAQVFSVKQDEEYEEEKVAKKMRDHALFIAYAPIDEPKIAVAVIVENGGHGSSTAAPIARKIMDAYLLGKHIPKT